MVTNEQQKTYPDQALRDACTAYLAASDLMQKAMEDGINVHGAMSGLIGATHNLHQEAEQKL